VDPRRWTGRADALDRPSGATWTRPLRTTPRLVAVPALRFRTAGDPKPPDARGALRFGIERPCHPAEGAEFGMIGLLGGVEGSPVLGGVVGGVTGGSGMASFGGRGLGSIGVGGGSPRPAPTPAKTEPARLDGCAGARCLAGTRAPEPGTSPIQLLFFQDAACEASDADRGLCRPGVPLSRIPTLALVDRARGRVLARPAPSGCVPRQTLSVRGVGLLLCAPVDGRTPLFLVDASGNWRAEGALAVALGEARASVASDGTLLLTPDRGGAFVRAPVALGDPAAWREVSVPDAVAYRPLDGGGALIVTSPTAAAGRKLSVWYEPAGGPRRELAHDVALEGDLLDVTAHQGHVVFLARDTGAPTTELYLAHASLLPYTGRRVFP